MCLTIPGKIINITGDIATIDYGSETREAKLIDEEFKIGDFVLVKAKVVVEKVPKDHMDAWLNVLHEINEREIA